MNENVIDNKQPQILIVDDIPANLRILRDALEPEGYNILATSNSQTALKIASGALPDLIILDIVMPVMDGYEVCQKLKQNEITQNIPVVFVTIKDDRESIIQGFRAGGADYIIKPYEKEEVLLRVKTHLENKRLTEILSQKNKELERRAKELIEINQQLQKANDKLLQEIERRQQSEQARLQVEEAFQKADEHLTLISQQEAKRWGIQGFIGECKTIKKILDDVRKLQNIEKTSVLICGESGTGKELIARAIHFGGIRAKGAFIALNCSTIPHELAESTLFGHIRGAFTGADANRKGYFELADEGTLFLDEIGDLPIELQPKLLRAIETGVITPVGSTNEKNIDVRFLAATNQKLESKINKGNFREDLYFRLARFTVTVPPLRERKEDIPLLAVHFLKLFASEMGIRQPVLSNEAIYELEKYHFPGNVRELKNIIEHALIKSAGSVIKPEHLHFIADSDISDDFTNFQKSDEQNTKDKEDFDYLKELVIKRSQKQYTENDEMTDEEIILEYVQEHGSINNSECRHLLSVDLHHASYLLKKLYEYGLLEREGERRWSHYRIPS